MSEMRRWWLW